MNILQFLGIQEKDITVTILTYYRYNRESMLLGRVFSKSHLVHEYLMWISRKQALRKFEFDLFNLHYTQWVKFRKQKGFLA